MLKIDDATKTKISDKIADVEQCCESELVCLVAQRSARYVLYPLLTAAILTLLLPFTQVFGSYVGLPALVVTFQHQAVIFSILAILLTCTPASHIVTPKWLKQQNCDRYSTEQFFQNHLHETRGRNGVLIFVSWQEKYVTIVADRGINEKVQQSDWDGLIESFVAAIKADDLPNGFLSIVGGAGDLLIEHFPAEDGKTDELPNHLIIQNGAPYVS